MNDEASLLTRGDDLEFVEEAYAKALGRAVDPKGLRDYLARLKDGVPRAQVLEELRQSDEGRAFAVRHGIAAPGVPAGQTVASLLGARDDASFVTGAHVALLGRNGSAVDVAGALSDLSAGRSRRAFLQWLRRSEEGRSARSEITDVHTLDLDHEQLAKADQCSLDLLLSTTDEAFVFLAYHRVLGRDPDLSGRSAYLKRVREGVARVAVLREMSASEEGRRRGATIAGLAEAAVPNSFLPLRVMSFARRAMAGARRAVRPPAASDQHREAPLPASAEVAASNAALEARPTRIPMPPPPESRLNSITKKLAARLASATRSAMQPQSPDTSHSGSQSMTDTFESTPTEIQVSDNQWTGRLEGFTGPTAFGWSRRGDQGAPCSITFGGRLVGALTPEVERPDLQGTSSTDSSPMGFTATLGGLLQFSALSRQCVDLVLEHPESQGSPVHVDLAAHWREALTYSPLKSFERLPPARHFGTIASIGIALGNEMEILFEARDRSSAPNSSVFLDAYQEAEPGQVDRLARFSIELGGQLSRFNLVLKSRHTPVLLVATDSRRNILATDCIPLPALHAEFNRPMIDYHCTIEGGAATYGVEAKIGRNHVDSIIRQRLDSQQAGNAPARATTSVLGYARGPYDFGGNAEFAALQGLSDHVGLLDNDGSVLLPDGRSEPLSSFVGATTRHILFVDVRQAIRPDFWALIGNNAFRFNEATKLVHWHEIVLRGVDRPYLSKLGLMLSPELRQFDLAPLGAALVDRDTVIAAIERDGPRLRSGRLELEHVFDELPSDSVVQVPIVLDTLTWPSPLNIEVRQRSEHMPAKLAMRPRPVPESEAGVSVLINYRNSATDTIRCLESVRSQHYSGPIEIVLVNNGSTPQACTEIISRAQALFGSDAVQAIDYPFAFNHSAQSNLAAKSARHDLLLMLSNDSVLLTEDAIRQACALSDAPWVATIGFRVIGGPVGKRALQSVGLGLAQRQFLFQGGSPLGRFVPPDFLHDMALETHGNTFAAVLVQRKTYFSLGGLDEEVFPTDYNDVDFCCRALQQGLRHVTIGTAVVEHVGRGSRDISLTQPIDQRILERCPDLATLGRLGISQL